MSETTLPQPSGPSIPASTVTLTPSPTTVITTDLITFTTILTFSIPIQPSQASPAPPTPPLNPPMTSLTDTNFIILISFTGATFLLVVILAITTICLFKKRRHQKTSWRAQKTDTETQEITTSSPTLTSFPLPPATPRLPAPSPAMPLITTDFPTTTPLFQLSSDTTEEIRRPLTAPPTRPFRSSSTPFLGPEYENKMFTSSLFPLRKSQFQFQKPSLPRPVPLATFGNPLPPFTFSRKLTASNLTNPSQTPAVFTETIWKFPPLPTPPTISAPRKASTPTRSTPIPTPPNTDRPGPRFTEEETQIGEIGAVESWFESSRASNSEVNIGEEEPREIFNFFRYPVSAGGQAAGTRASSGVFPDEREGGREGREDG